MRTLFIAFISVLIFVSCKNDEAKNDQGSERLADKKVPDPIDSSKFTTVQWLDSLQDFGKVKNGEKVNVSFRFKNTGQFPLIVESATPGCGCTIPEMPKESIMPGKEGVIKAVFNSLNQAPTVHKTIVVGMNTRPSTRHEISFIGEVVNQ